MHLDEITTLKSLTTQSLIMINVVFVCTRRSHF